jgi:ferredoxin
MVIDGEAPGGGAAIGVAADPELCCGSGQCAALVPAVFGQSEHDGTVLLLDPRPPSRLAAAVRAAANRCPARAITVSGGR